MQQPPPGEPQPHRSTTGEPARHRGRESGQTPQPVFSRAIAAMVCGLLSLPTCCLFGLPALVLGGVAIWLSIWTLQHYHGNVTGEFASIAALIGLISGAIGVILGLIGTMMLVMGTFGVMFERMIGVL